ncbi:MAG: cytochrome C [Roseomonas sp.]|nr:cytochrome C [Roseomonas sp.]MCA3328972.1 cytochrome C [Roseomonas sp.]MCA3332034.1 cytochrome C [Roseomonas sp.]MCA3334682.1 cytochrome C [Roseomonas sp.]MCA3355090.1 cytochrome C [Roseomonas sp.]
MKLRLSLCLLLATASPAFAQATDVPLLIGGCQGCHGVSGQGGHGIPSIKANHSRDEFIALMRAFSANERPATVMGRISRGYTPEQIALLAAHYARPQ